MSLEGVQHVNGGDSLAVGVFRVRDRVADYGLKEGLEDSTDLLVGEAGDALHTTSTSEAADGGLGDSLDVVP